MAGVAKWINQLKDIRSGLNALNKPNFISIIGSLDRVINFLENYLKEEKYHEPASKDEQNKLKERIRKELNSSEDKAKAKSKKNLTQHQINLTVELENIGLDEPKRMENRAFVEATQ